MTELLKLIKTRQSSRTPFDTNRPIQQEHMQQILEAASWAPTAHNMQNFEIVVVDDKKLLHKIRNIKFSASETFIRENYQQLSFSEEELKRKKTGVLVTMFPKSWQNPELFHIALTEEHNADDEPPLLESHNHVLSCPALLIMLYDPKHRAPASEGDFLGIMSMGCVLENMWLMAASLGIGLHIVSSLSDAPAEKEVKQILNIPDNLAIAISFRLGYPIASPDYLRVRRNLNNFVHHNKFGVMGI